VVLHGSGGHDQEREHGRRGTSTSPRRRRRGAAGRRGSGVPVSREADVTGAVDGGGERRERAAAEVASGRVGRRGWVAMAAQRLGMMMKGDLAGMLLCGRLV
jgi:hypothetical protein